MTKSGIFIGLLLASLAANACMGGILLGKQVEARRAAHVLETEKKVTIGEITESIPDLQKQKFSNAKEWLQREVAGQIGEIRVKRDQSLQVLTAREFDRQAFDAIEDEIIEIRQSIFRKRKNMVGFLASNLSYEDRQRLAISLKKGTSKDK